MISLVGRWKLLLDPKSRDDISAETQLGFPDQVG
jgi:hypothetical protein